MVDGACRTVKLKGPRFSNPTALKEPAIRSLPNLRRRREADDDKNAARLRRRSHHHRSGKHQDIGPRAARAASKGEGRAELVSKNQDRSRGV